MNNCEQIISRLRGKGLDEQKIILRLKRRRLFYVVAVVLIICTLLRLFVKDKIGTTDVYVLIILFSFITSGLRLVFIISKCIKKLQ